MKSRVARDAAVRFVFALAGNPARRAACGRDWPHGSPKASPRRRRYIILVDASHVRWLTGYSQLCFIIAGWLDKSLGGPSVL
eukprot:COSAG06_NODE_30617_length_535_cov_1.408257_1_plen_81_part_10